MRDKLDILLDDIWPLASGDEEEFQELEYDEIEAVSYQGDDEQGAALIDGNWIPKSQLRSDSEGGLYISVWLYAKLF